MSFVQTLVRAILYSCSVNPCEEPYSRSLFQVLRRFVFLLLSNFGMTLRFSSLRVFGSPVNVSGMVG